MALRFSRRFVALAFSGGDCYTNGLPPVSLPFQPYSCWHRDSDLTLVVRVPRFDRLVRFIERIHRILKLSNAVYVIGDVVVHFLRGVLQDGIEVYAKPTLRAAMRKKRTLAFVKVQMFREFCRVSKKAISP